jgi:hypothetical protein
VEAASGGAKIAMKEEVSLPSIVYDLLDDLNDRV